MDFTDGSTRPVKRGEVFACLSPIEFRFHEPWQYDGITYTKRFGGDALSLCTSEGKRASGQLTGAHLEGVGAHFDDATVVARKGAFVAYGPASAQ